jgi:hypothetical protein
MEPVSQQQLHVAAAGAAGNDAPAADWPDWENLPPELVYKVADIVLRSEVRGYFRMRAVCKAWRRAAV